MGIEKATKALKTLRRKDNPVNSVVDYCSHTWFVIQQKEFILQNFSQIDLLVDEVNNKKEQTSDSIK